MVMVRPSPSHAHAMEWHGHAMAMPMGWVMASQAWLSMTGSRIGLGQG